MTDALGNPIETGMYYGYSRITNGKVNVVIGRAIKVTDMKVTLDNITEQWGAYGSPERIKKPKRARSVYSKTVFPVDINTLNINKDLLGDIIKSYEIIMETPYQTTNRNMNSEKVNWIIF